MVNVEDDPARIKGIIILEKHTTTRWPAFLLGWNRESVAGTYAYNPDGAGQDPRK